MSADGAFLLGVMASTRSTEGESIFPAERPTSGIIVDGKVDLGLSLRRELKEETGLDMTAFDVEPGWTMSVDGALIAQIKVLRSNESANSPARTNSGISRKREKAGTGGHPYRARSRAISILPCRAMRSPS